MNTNVQYMVLNESTDMEEKKQHDLLEPLIDSSGSSTKASSSISPSDNYSIILRLVLVILGGLVSLWANFEASKGFAISVGEETTPVSTLSGRRFHLFFVSNDEATRLILKSSQHVENILYPAGDKKQVNHVILQLSNRNLSGPVVVEPRPHHEYIVHISSSVLESPDYKLGTSLAVEKGVARVWLWDGEGNAPVTLVNGMVQYIVNTTTRHISALQSGSGFNVSLLLSSCWESNDPRTVAEFLSYCETVRPGFVAKLNQAMRYGWHDNMIHHALGFPAQTRKNYTT